MTWLVIALSLLSALTLIYLGVHGFNFAPLMAFLMPLA